MLELCWDEAFAVLGHPQQSLLGQSASPGSATAATVRLSCRLPALAPRCRFVQPAKLCPCGGTAGGLCPGVLRRPAADALSSSSRCSGHVR